MDKEKYERDVDNFIDYTNENNEDYKKHHLKLVREKELGKEFINPTGLAIFLGLLLIASVLGYGFYYDKINIELDCGNESLVCGEDTFNCDTEPCPACTNI